MAIKFHLKFIAQRNLMFNLSDAIYMIKLFLN